MAIIALLAAEAACARLRSCNTSAVDSGDPDRAGLAVVEDEVVLLLGMNVTP
jgi:hypothetical protein